MKQVTEAELKALSFVLPWVRVPVSREDGGIVNCVPVSPEMRDRLIATIREQRAKIGNGELIPGVVVKDSVVHRRWSDPEVAAQLAQETIGDKAFKRELLSPAQMEKLGDEGKSFVAVASFKPEAGKRVVY